MRTYQQLRASYWDSSRNRKEPLSADEILVELFLITGPHCGPSGVFTIGTETIGFYTGLENEPGNSVTDLFGNPKVKSVLESLLRKGRIKIYPGGWIWVIGKWEHESKSPNAQKGLFIEIEAAPSRLIADFMEAYSDTFTEDIPGRVIERACLAPTEAPTQGNPPAKVSVRINKQDQNQDQKEKKLHTVDKSPDSESPEYLAIVSELLPHVDGANKIKQAKALRLLIEQDGAKIAPKLPAAEWKARVLSVLRWMRSDTEPHGTFPGWSKVFNSIPRLRENSCEKFLNAAGAYDRSKGTRNPSAKQTIIDPVKGEVRI